MTPTEPFYQRRIFASARVVLGDPKATHYEVLGVSPGACDVPTLTAARRHLALMFHPDRLNGPTAHDLMARANEAFDVLSDEKRRKLYNAQLRSTHTPCSPCGGEGFTLKQKGFKGKAQLRCMGCDGKGWHRK